jgi:hypothetical protein
MADPRSLSSILEGLVYPKRATTPAHSTDGGEAGAHLAFTGNWQDPCPRLLLMDTSLEPVDIVTWQVIRIHAEPGKLVAFPTYRDLMRWVRVSRATVARAVTVLRLARWLPLAASARNAEGRFLGNVYALQDEALPLAEMLRADDRYVHFAEQCRTHRHAHVRELADVVCNAVQEVAVRSNMDALRPVDLNQHLAARFERMIDLFEQAQKNPRAVPDRGDTQVQILNSADSSRAIAGQVQDLNLARAVQNLNSVSSSSSKNLRNTTTTKYPRFQNRERGENTLSFPAELGLTDSQCRVLALRIDCLPEATRQDVIDEATARILAKRRSADPVRCEFDYIARLATCALNGEFVLTDMGERLRNRRTAQVDGERRLAKAREHSEVQRLKELAVFRARRAGGNAK